MAEALPQDSFAEKEEKSDHYSDNLGIEDLLDTESDDRVCVLLVAAGLLVYHPRTFLQHPIIRDLTAVYSLTTGPGSKSPKGHY